MPESHAWIQFTLLAVGIIVTGLNESAIRHAQRRIHFASHLSDDALAKAANIQRAIFDCPNFSCIATDANGLVQVFSVGAQKLFGYSAAEVVNKFTPADLGDHEETVARAKALSLEFGTPVAPGLEELFFKAARGIEDIHNVTKIRKDGSRFPALVSITALRDASEGIIGYLIIGTDNTARKQIEEERKRSEANLRETNAKLEIAKSAAEKANQAKSEFLSNMSHELRTPLNAILGFAQLMEGGNPPPTPGQTKSINQILHGGWYLLKLINEILDLAAIESGKLSLAADSVSLSDVMTSCRNMVEPQALQRGIELIFPQFDYQIFVRADRTRLEQILINLLSNAIKYNEDNGKVVVDWTFNSADRIRISVRDTGAGLPPEKLARLFTPFNRLGQESGKITGTGIGLVVSKRLAEAMDGVLGAESTVGKGSIFWCEFSSAVAPRDSSWNETTESTDAALEARAGRQHTLLYIEDSPANMQLVEELVLRFPEMRLLTAVNANIGLELARSAQPEVILMDLNLPGISGVEALGLLREDPSTAHIPVIAVSANAMQRDIDLGLAAGFFCYLTKPIKIKEFISALRSAIKFAEEQLVPAGNGRRIS